MNVDTKGCDCLGLQVKAEFKPEPLYSRAQTFVHEYCVRISWHLQITANVNSELEEKVKILKISTFSLPMNKLIPNSLLILAQVNFSIFHL